MQRSEGDRSCHPLYTRGQFERLRQSASTGMGDLSGILEAATALVGALPSDSSSAWVVNAYRNMMKGP